MSTNPAFVPLDAFWSQFFETTTRRAPLPRDGAVVDHYLGGVFGDLTEHRVAALERAPFRIACTDCRNNTDARRDSVCRTHLGVLQGLLQAMTHVPLDAAFKATANEECQITFKVAAGADGREAAAYAVRLDGIVLRADGYRAFLIDTRSSAVHALTPEAYAVLRHLDQERDAAALAGLTGLGEPTVRSLLDQCYTMGWISCRFK